MTTALLPEAGAEDDLNASALIEEARHRQRRRQLVVAVLLGTILSGAAVAYGVIQLGGSPTGDDDGKQSLLPPRHSSLANLILVSPGGARGAGTVTGNATSSGNGDGPI